MGIGTMVYGLTLLSAKDHLEVMEQVHFNRRSKASNETSS